MRLSSSPLADAGDPVAPACATMPDLYLHDLLDTPPASGAGKAVRTEYAELVSKARDLCAACPLFVDCLYRSVVQVDVTGFVGCTTARERTRIRRVLGIAVGPEDLDAAAGVRVEGRPLDHATVLATRAAYPDDSLESLAERLGCSLSTVKRHLRRARREAAESRSRPKAHNTDVPSVDEVLDGFDAVVEDDR